MDKCLKVEVTRCFVMVTFVWLIQAPPRDQWEIHLKVAWGMIKGSWNPGKKVRFPLLFLLLPNSNSSGNSKDKTSKRKNSQCHNSSSQIKFKPRSPFPRVDEGGCGHTDRFWQMSFSYNKALEGWQLSGMNHSNLQLCVVGDISVLWASQCSKNSAFIVQD